MTVFISVIFLIVLITILDLSAELLDLKGKNKLRINDVSVSAEPENRISIINYNLSRIKFNIISLFSERAILIAVLLLNWPSLLEKQILALNLPFVFSAVLYISVVIIAVVTFELPFSYYSTFILEAKYGFNKSTVTVFFTDLVKSLFLSFVIVIPLFLCIVFLFENNISYAWILCWLLLSVFQLLLTYIAPVIILPMFNKFTSLEDGELKKRIKEYARQQLIYIDDIYKMDGSRRTSKSNAFFTGFGKYKKIVLYDTIILKHTVSELLAIIAHEAGHLKKNHIRKHFIFSCLSNALMLYLMSSMIYNGIIYYVFSISSTYSAVILFFVIYLPVNYLMSVIYSNISRKHEYEADKFSADSTTSPEYLADALERLATDNKADPYPHPLKVFLHYSHPPVSERIKRLRADFKNFA